MTQRKKQSGFTLVELAIVLVIIGLIIGGVLVGQDLIKAATIRAAVTDIERFNAGATTFQGKYGGLPGDLAGSKAVEYGLTANITDACCTGGAGLRNGNGVLEDSPNTATTVNFSGETLRFWQDLGNANLIPSTYTTLTTAQVGPAVAVTAANSNLFIPRSKLRDSASYHAYSGAGRNYFYLGAVTQASGATPWLAATGDAVTALEAKGIDEKLDDGVPRAGTVQSYSGLAVQEALPGATASTECTTAGTVTTSTYNVADNNSGAPNNPVCQLRLRTSF